MIRVRIVDIMERYPFYSCNSTRLTGLVELSLAKLEESNSAGGDPARTFSNILRFSTFFSGNALLLRVYAKDQRF